VIKTGEQKGVKSVGNGNKPRQSPHLFNKHGNEEVGGATVRNTSSPAVDQKAAVKTTKGGRGAELKPAAKRNNQTSGGERKDTQSQDSVDTKQERTAPSGESKPASTSGVEQRKFNNTKRREPVAGGTRVVERKDAGKNALRVDGDKTSNVRVYDSSVGRNHRKEREERSRDGEDRMRDGGDRARNGGGDSKERRLSLESNKSSISGDLSVTAGSESSKASTPKPKYTYTKVSAVDVCECVCVCVMDIGIVLLLDYLNLM